MRIIICFLFLVVSTVAQATEHNVSGSVTKVTVFPAQAEVTREVRLSLKTGKNIIQFENVPGSLDPDSLRLSGEAGSAIILQGAELKHLPLATNVSAETQVLQDKLILLERDRDSLDRISTRIDRDRARLEEIRLETFVPSEKAKPQLRTPKEMAEILAFLNESFGKLENETKGVQKQLVDLNAQIDLLKRQLAGLGSQKYVTVVEATVEASADTSARLELTYQTRGATWSPAYNLNLAKEQGYESELELETFGLVSQNTGEDWNEVQLYLSTARPQIALNRPDPSPKILDILQVFPQRALQKSKSDVRSLMMLEQNAPAAAAAGSVSEEARDLMDEVQISEADAELISSGVSLSYKIAHKVSLKSGGSKEKVKIGSAKFTARMLNVAVPSVNPEVFRELTLVNSSEAPLLPGPVGIFMAGAFVGKQRLGFTAVNEEIKLPVGISEEVGVKRKLIKKFAEDPGLVRSFKRTSLSYKIEITNRSSKPQKLVVLDSKPISRNEQIKVSIDQIKPNEIEYKNPLRYYKDEGAFEWQFDLKAGEKNNIDYAFAVERPADLAVSGEEYL